MKKSDSKTAETEPLDSAYRRARSSVRVTEDEALNAICDARLNEPRLPLDKLLKRLEHELDE